MPIDHPHATTDKDTIGALCALLPFSEEAAWPTATSLLAVRRLGMGFSDIGATWTEMLLTS